MKTNYRYCSLEILICPDSNNIIFVTNFKQIREISKKTYETVATFV